MTAQRRVTLDEVARAASVSKATASKVLNGRGGISNATRSKVERALRDLEYLPVSRAVPGADGRSVVVVFDALVSLYSLKVLEGLVGACQRADVELVVHVASADAGGGLGIDRRWVQGVVQRGHTGVVMVTTAVEPELVAACRDLHLPLVAVDAPAVGHEDVVSIGSDHFRGGLQAVRHLVGLGHHRIAFVGGDATNPGLRERLGGYREGLAEAGIAFDSALVSEAGMTSAGAEVPRMLALAEPPTAVFATNDGDAALAFRAARLAGRAVPEDLSIIGYDDTYSMIPNHPSMSTVHTPMQDIGRLAVEAVLDLADGVEPISRRVTLATELVVRESTAPPGQPLHASVLQARAAG